MKNEMKTMILALTFALQSMTYSVHPAQASEGPPAPPACNRERVETLFLEGALHVPAGAFSVSNIKFQVVQSTRASGTSFLVYYSWDATGFEGTPEQFMLPMVGLDTYSNTCELISGGAHAVFAPDLSRFSRSK